MNKDDIFKFETKLENGWQILYVSLAWDNAKSIPAPFHAAQHLDSIRETAIQMAIGKLWTQYADEIIEHIQNKKVEELRNVSIDDIPLGSSKEVLIRWHRQEGKLKP